MYCEPAERWRTAICNRSGVDQAKLSSEIDLKWEPNSHIRCQTFDRAVFGTETVHSISASSTRTILNRLLVNSDQSLV